MSNKVYVGNLPYSFTNEDLKNLFAAYGPVRHAEVIIDRMTNRSRGFGFVELETSEALQQVIQSLHDTELQGRRLTVNEARERAPGGARPGSGFGGPRPGGGFGAPRAGGSGGPRPAGAGPGPRPGGGFGGPRGPAAGGGGSGGPARGAPPRGGRPKREESDRWSDGGGRRRRNDEDFGDE
ncbi:MAG: RNA-binding protein [Planctomycetes bacterium]|nr:RNA-binding protein [Planctomycetota bacterium]